MAGPKRPSPGGEAQGERRDVGADSPGGGPLPSAASREIGSCHLPHGGRQEPGADSPGAGAKCRLSRRALHEAPLRNAGIPRRSAGTDALPHQSRGSRGIAPRQLPPLGETRGERRRSCAMDRTRRLTGPEDPSTRPLGNARNAARFPRVGMLAQDDRVGFVWAEFPVPVIPNSELNIYISPRPRATLRIKSWTLVTMVVAERLPRSRSLLTTNSSASTQ